MRDPRRRVFSDTELGFPKVAGPSAILCREVLTTVAGAVADKVGVWGFTGFEGLDLRSSKSL